MNTNPHFSQMDCFWSAATLLSNFPGPDVSCNCETNPCQNGGICNGVDGTCYCIDRFTGQFCETAPEWEKLNGVVITTGSGKDCTRSDNWSPGASTEENQVELCKQKCLEDEGCAGFDYTSRSWCYFKYCNEGWNKQGDDGTGVNFYFSSSSSKTTYYLIDS